MTEPADTTTTPDLSPDGAVAADRRFFAALLATDVAALETLLDPQFVVVDVAAGDVTTRDDFIAVLAQGLVRFDRIDTFHDEALVRRLADCAAVICRTEMRVRLPDGTTATTSSRYTHVFTPHAGTGWRLASAQGTPITRP